MSVKNVKTLKIMVKTNVDKHPYELTLSKIHNASIEPPIAWTKKSEYPFFTEDIEYPEDILSNKTYSELLHIFFDKREFIRVIINRETPVEKPAIEPPAIEKTGGSSERNADKNIMIMLQFLFPTSYPYKNNINTSFNKYLKKKSPPIKISIGEIKSIVYGGKYSYLNTSSGVCTVTEVIWLNDVLNNSIYRELVNKLIQYEEWKKTIYNKIAQDIESDTKTLTEGLSTSPTSSGADKLRISAEEIEQLYSQKRIYNPDDIKKDMIDIIKKYLVIEPGKAELIEKELDKLTEYFIDTFVKDKPPLTQFVRFKEKFNFKYSENDIEHDLVKLHKLYDGADKVTKIAEKNAQKTSKETERDKIQKGYVERNTWFFGKEQIEQYIQNLDKLISIAIAVPVGGQNKKQAPEQAVIDGVLFENITVPPEYTNIMIIPGVKYTKSSFSQIYRPSSVDNRIFIDEVTKRIDAITTDAINAMSTKIDTIQSEITKLDQEIIELGKSNIDAFSFKGETNFTAKMSLDNIKNAVKSDIQNIQQEIFKTVIARYNRFQEINKSENLRGEYAEIDGVIDNIINYIEKLNNLSTPTPNDILNITESIKTLFDKLLTSKKIDISRTIGEKLAKIIKLSNHIKLLNQIQTDFFPKKSTGIFVNYNTELDKANSFNALILDELKTNTYATFVSTVSFIQEKFMKQFPIKSLNKEFSEMLENYFTNKSNAFYENILEPASKLINEGVYPSSISDLWNVSVILRKRDSAEDEYEISLYMNLIEGEINATNKAEINCQFLDDELTRRFKELVDEGNVTFEPPENKEVFSIKKAKDEKIKHEKERKEKIASSIKHREPRKSQEKKPSTSGGNFQKTKSKKKTSVKRTQKNSRQ